MGEVIRARRETLELSQEDVAQRLGVTRNAVQQWESGATHPRTKRLRALAALLQCDLVGNKSTGGGGYKLTPWEETHLAKVRRLSAANREAVAGLADHYLRTQRAAAQTASANGDSLKAKPKKGQG